MSPRQTVYELYDKGLVLPCTNQTQVEHHVIKAWIGPFLGHSSAAAARQPIRSEVSQRCAVSRKHPESHAQRLPLCIPRK